MPVDSLVVAVKATDTKLRDPITSELTRLWQLTVYMDDAVVMESGRKERRPRV